MARVCRICLKKANFTLKTCQVLDIEGPGSIKIALALRFCVPELYLGLVSNPEICRTCKNHLKIAYQFKKKCLATENVIENYVKNARCTGESVELHDVLAYIEELKKSGTYVESDLKGLLNKNAQQKNDEFEVRQSAPNPKRREVVINPINSGIIIQNGKVLNIVGSISVGRSTEITQPVEVTTMLNTPPVVPNDTLPNIDESYSFCKISEVFSLSENPENSNVPEEPILKKDLDQDLTEQLIEIKDEPLDLELKNDLANLSRMPTDEETLDSTEAACQSQYSPSTLQGLIDSIPEIGNSDVDVPDFVTISKFGFKELEDFKLQQQSDEPAKSFISDKPDSSSSSGSKVVAYDTLQMVEILPNVPEKILRDENQKVKCDDLHKVKMGILSALTSDKKNVTSQTQENIISSPVRNRIRKKFKMVALDGQSDMFKSNQLTLRDKQIVKLPKTDEENQKDVVFLFTKYTWDGYYINDHDYLVSPYKRNKILLNKDSTWFCICYICGKMHYVSIHAKHMTQHGGYCNLCQTNLETPYMLNIHYKEHRKSCRYCSSLVPYALFKSHIKEHIEQEQDDLKRDPKRKCEVMGRGSRRIRKDDEPVCFPLPKREDSDLEKTDNSMSEQPNKYVSEEPYKSEMTESQDDVGTNSFITDVMEEWRKPRRGRPRKKGGSSRKRVLRSTKRKYYVESKDDIFNEECNVPIGAGMSSDLKI